MTRRARLVIAATVTVAAMSMVLIGTFQSSVPFVGPGDLTPDHEDRRVQIEGIVETMTVMPDHLLLELSDGGEARALIRYDYAGQRPLALEEGRLVVAKGLYRDGVLESHQVSVRAHDESGAGPVRRDRRAQSPRNHRSHAVRRLPLSVNIA